MAALRRASDIAAKLPLSLLLYDGRCLYTHSRLTWALGHSLSLEKDDPRVFHVATLDSVVGKFVLQHQPKHVRDAQNFILVEKVRRWSSLRSLLPGVAGQGAQHGIDWDLRTYTKSKAVLRIVSKFDHPYYPYIARIAFWVVPRPLGDAFFDWVMSSRYAKFGKSDGPIKVNDEIKARTWTRF